MAEQPPIATLAKATLAKLETRRRTLGGEVHMERGRGPGLSEPKPEMYLRVDRLPYHGLLKHAPDVTSRGATQ